jgi:lipopolysaccharide/colanic/teichoic acid biosynthesis glycosyltransferase
MAVRESILTGCENRVDDSTRSPINPNPNWKRIIDVFLVVVLSPLWFPLMLIIAMGIKVASKGPILFRQERVGHRGRTFLCLKFRSMHCNADVTIHEDHLSQLMNSDEPMVKLDRGRDPRLIPFGKILRASGLDELPQIFNVLAGDMSLVGPRPCTRHEYDGYKPWHKERFAVLPGLTGLWQVSGKNTTTFEEMIRLDIRYGRELSLKRDLWILAKTFGVLCGQMVESIKRPQQATITNQQRKLTRNEKLAHES